MLREDKPAADSCGDPLLEEHIGSLLPVGCGAEPVFNFSWDKEMEPYGSGNDDKDDIYHPEKGATAVPTRTLMWTSSLLDRSKLTEGVKVPVNSNRSSPRLPPRFTPSPEIRHSSFQHLLRLHLNAFNKRLTMLEGNTLDMKESIRSMENQQSRLNTHLMKLIAVHSLQDKDKKISELERSYTDMDSRLKKLEGRLEILIDGFTALAQQMNKMKRARHASRRLQEKRFLPPLSTVIAVPLYSTPQSVIRAKPTESPLTVRATVPKSIPTPSVVLTKQSHLVTPQRNRKLKSRVITTTKSLTLTKSAKSHVPPKQTNKFKTTLGKENKTVPKSTLETPVKPQTKRPKGSRSSVTAKHISQPRQTKSRKTKQEAAVTKFQLEPPAHKSKPSTTSQLHKQSGQAKKKDSLPLIKNSGRDKAVRSDAPVQKTSKDNSKKLSEPHKGNSKQNYKRTKESPKKVSTNTQQTKPSAVRKTQNSAKRTSNSNSKSPSLKTSDTTVHNKVRSSIVHKTSKKREPKEKANSKSGVMDLLKLLNGDYQSSKRRKDQEGSLHIVLGKLAIPIKIIPDD
ncbi:PREDICTED: proteoglycan 4-like [Poecilia mexicana]|uniref:proteoglycan 4-like n=1 Tax=Poecilia mexicana TaxID=48701 RepID=UPI00072E4C1A|nr:PREDICTED: proteoglycan 4-like [Poecilia mexicana]